MGAHTIRLSFIMVCVKEQSAVVIYVEDEDWGKCGIDSTVHTWNIIVWIVVIWIPRVRSIILAKYDNLE